MISRNIAAAAGAMAPAAASAARSWVAGRSTRSDRQVPPTATGGRIACSRTANCPVPSPRQLHRRPRAARRRAGARRPAPAAAPVGAPRPRRRTESALRRKPFPSSTHTASGRGHQDVGGARRRTAAARGCPRRSAPSAAPADWSAPRCRRAPRRIRPGSPRRRRWAAAGADLGGQPFPHPIDQRRVHAAAPARAALTGPPAQHREHPCGGPASGDRRPQSQAAVLQTAPPAGVRDASRPAAAAPATSATSAARNPPGDGPRTTRPTFGLMAVSAGAIAAVGRARPHVARADARPPDRRHPARSRRRR